MPNFATPVAGVAGSISKAVQTFVCHAKGLAKKKDINGSASQRLLATLPSAI
jgi:hypothetical protein